MSNRKPLVALVVASVAFSSLAFVGRALAASPTTCTSDAECSKGFTCQPWAVSGGTAPACPPDASDCGVASDTPKSGAGATGGVTGGGGASGVGGGTGSDVGSGNVSGTAPSTTVVSRCEPGPCQTDSDCGADMVCHTESYSECSGGAAVAPCEPNTKCDSTPVATDVTCTTKSVSFCAFHWQLPCNADADCGAGFTCQPHLMGTCSGGSGVSGGTGSAGEGGTGGSASSEPGRSASSPPDSCTTTMTFPGSCQPVATICNVDADCPADWVCQDTVTAPSRGQPTGAGAASGSGDVASGTNASAAGTAPAADVTGGGTTASSRMCVSPFIPPKMASDGGGGGRLGGSEGSGTPTNGTSGTGGTTVVPGTDSPSGPAAGSGGASGAAHAGDSAGAPNDAGGCSVGGSVAGSRTGAALSILALLGLGAVLRRRRS